jgi:hypothetical protein
MSFHRTWQATSLVRLGYDEKVVKYVSSTDH